MSVINQKCPEKVMSEAAMPFFQISSISTVEKAPRDPQQAVLDTYTRHQSDIIQVENFGELVGWKVADCLEIVLKTDFENLAKLVNQFTQNDVDINHELKLLKIEIVDVEGAATVVKYEKKYLKGQTIKYSYAPVHWNGFVAEVKGLYAKIRDVTNPKIKIENGSPKWSDTVKTKSKRFEDKNTLDVASTSEHRRHKKKKEVKKPPKKEKKSSKLVKQNSVVEAQVKPPNVLVYADSVVTRDNVKRVLYSILSKEKYTVYDLPIKNSWDKSTVLVVVCGGVPPNLTSNLIQYLLSGGQLLCLCSDLMYSVLHTFTTAEVREHELVRFTYGAWERVKMMHHIFCYQASPAKKQFSKDSDQSNHSSDGSPLAPRTPSNVELKHNDKEYNIQVQVLGTEETWHTPSLLLAKVKGSEGRAVFSQVHLEIDPEEYENDEDKYQSLRESNGARLEILKDILERHLEVECDDSLGKVEYTLGYFLGRYDSKMDLISNSEIITGNQLTCDKINIVFCGHNVDPGPCTNIRLPVLIHSCPSNFSTLDYFETLDTEDIGRLVIYSDILTSSQHLLQKKLRHGLVVIAKQQTNGMGRSSNTWLSPPGAASFSLQLHIPMKSSMGERLSLVQQLVMVAVVSAVKDLHGYEGLDLGIKWPNDLYASNVKIGGILTTSTIIADDAIVNIGCGVNLSNNNPTTCINDVIAKLSPALKPISHERFFAIVFNKLERLYREIQLGGTDAFFNLYYKHWLHSGASISIQNERGEEKQAKIVGLDEFGFLRVRLVDGTLTTVQPDGNTFDMMRGLIAPKVF